MIFCLFDELVVRFFLSIWNTKKTLVFLKKLVVKTMQKPKILKWLKCLFLLFVFKLRI